MDSRAGGIRSQARAFVDPDSASPLGETRSRVLELLRAAPGPLGVRDLAAATGLHPNTARFHLDGLVEAGLAARSAEDRGRPGRPRMVYTPVAGEGAAAGRRSFRLLAEMLTSMLAGSVPEPVTAATDAGREWGRYLVERPAPSRQVDADQAVRRLVDALEEVGFAPEATDGGRQVRLHHCPFREVAENHPDLVCGLHLGLMQGVLAELRAPLTTDRLDPFVEPSLCLAHLAARTGRPEPSDGANLDRSARDDAPRPSSSDTSGADAAASSGDAT